MKEMHGFDVIHILDTVHSKHFWIKMTRMIMERPEQPLPQRRRQRPRWQMRPIVDIRAIPMERYDAHATRLQDKSKAKRIIILGISRHTLFASILLTICQYAMVDEYSLLPIGFLAYTVGIFAAWEQLQLEWQQDSLFDDRIQQMDHNTHTTALFEYQVLKNRPNVRIVPVYENGITKLYAVG